MADRTDIGPGAGGRGADDSRGNSGTDIAAGRRDWTVSRPAPARDVGEARRELEATRLSLSRDLDDIEARIRATGGDIRERLDLLTPTRERIRADIWKSLGLAFAAGLAYAILTARREDGRRPFLGNVLRSAVAQFPGALASGIRAGLGDRLRQELHDRPAAA